MIDLSIENILLLTATIIGGELIICARLLQINKSFGLLNSGFWAIVAFLLYFVLTPVFVVFTGDVNQFKASLDITDGMNRSLWILFNTFVGIFVFIVFYIRTKTRVITWGLSEVYHLKVSSFFILLLCFGFGIYSLLTFRTGILENYADPIITAGRFKGEIIGYQHSGYIFLYLPIILLLISPGKLERFLGLLMSSLFIVFSLPDAWSRYITVSMIIAIILVIEIKRKAKWSISIVLLLLLVIFVAPLFQMRGHVEWEISNISQNVNSLLQEYPFRISKVLAGSDTSMLASWYLSSYLHDRYIGYDYGIPLLNYMILGFVPGRILPQKYFLIDQLRLLQGNSYPIIIDQYLLGAKSSLLGDFYANGGVIGVILGMAIAGFLSKRLDGMLFPHTPALVKAVGIAWASLLWIAWGSGSFWVFSVFGIVSFPAICLWIVSRYTKENRIGSDYSSQDDLNNTII